MKNIYIIVLLLAICFGLLMTINLKAQCSVNYQNNQNLPAVTNPVTYISTGTNVSVLNGQNVQFHAGSYVLLNPGFLTITGGVFLGDIAPKVLTGTVTSILASTGSCPGGCLHYTITANPSGGSGDYSYSWSTGETSQTIVTVPGSTTTYSVTILDNCTNQNVTSQITVTGVDTHYQGAPTFQFYNYISPNGDGINDHFELYDNGKTQYAFNSCHFEFTVYVYDEYGDYYEVNHSSGDAGSTGFAEGAIYWDAQVKNYIYHTILTLGNCNGSTTYLNDVEVGGSPYTHFRLARDTSINLNQVHTIDFYPNPSSGMINFHFNGEKEEEIEISIYSNIGEKVYENIFGKTTNITTTINLSTVPKGFYTAKIKSETETVFKKLIVN
jgi:hypothetical protein